MSAPLILGAGPAGCAAAIVLAEAGRSPVLIDRDAMVGDPLCGGFISWQTVAGLRKLGIDAEALGAHRVERLALFAGDRSAQVRLPDAAWGLSRHALDTALRERALLVGASLEIDRARSLAPGIIEGEKREWRSDAIFLATGKHDVRGESRPRHSDDPALGLRVRLPAHPKLAELVGDAIELHLFDGAYVGIVLQEDGSANVCVALRKSRLAKSGTPLDLLNALANSDAAFAERWRFAPPEPSIDTIGAVPYGWIADGTEQGLYRLGDQAAVIPSLAGEGMGIAIASGRSGARSYLEGTSAPDWQRTFSRRAARPVAIAEAIWKAAETPVLARLGLSATAMLPTLATMAMRASRI
ncbi:MAG: FAD-dependent monooxygenase [Erythrobacter sp.]|nr:FAD-dependent monooxygenase [Erythrobacter sp.]